MSNQELYNYLCDLFKKSFSIDITVKGDFLNSDYNYLIDNFSYFNLYEVRIDKKTMFGDMDTLQISFVQRVNDENG